MMIPRALAWQSKRMNHSFRGALLLAEAGIHIKYNNVQIHVNGEERELKPHYLLDTNVVAPVVVFSIIPIVPPVYINNTEVFRGYIS